MATRSASSPTALTTATTLPPSEPSESESSAAQLNGDCWSVVSEHLSDRDLLSLHGTCKYLRQELDWEVERRFHAHKKVVGDLRWMIQRLTRLVLRGDPAALAIAADVRRRREGGRSEPSALRSLAPLPSVGPTKSITTSSGNAPLRGSHASESRLTNSSGIGRRC